VSHYPGISSSVQGELAEDGEEDPAAEDFLNFGDPDDEQQTGEDEEIDLFELED
jgi:hypothetical protein